jgi:tetratricopeptide (TPR) repeat protein
MAILGLARYAERDQQISLLRRANRLRSRLTEREQLHLDLQVALTEKGRDAALKIAGQIRERFPDDIRAAQFLCSNELRSGNVERALAIFAELLAVDPNNAEAYNQIGYYHAYRGDYEKAIENLKKYQFMAPDQANPHDSLGEVQAYSGRYDEAIANLERALKVKPDFMPAYEHLGVAYEGRGDLARAIESYQKAADGALSEEQRGRYLVHAFRAAMIAGDRERTEELFSRLDALPKKGEIALGMPIVSACMRLLEGKPAEAERLLLEARPKWEAEFAKQVKAPGYKPYWAGWTYVMALTKRSLDQRDEAITLFEQMANPPNGWRDFEERRMVYEGRAHLAALLARRGDLDRAEKLLEANRKWNPSWAPTREQEQTVARLRREKVLAAAR